MKGIGMKLLWVFLSVVAVHFAVQFVAWSFAPGNAARDLTGTFFGKPCWWRMLSFPLFWALSENLEGPFWLLLFINSVLWGTGGAIVFVLLKR